MNLSSAQLTSYAQQAGFTGASVAIIVGIALAESGGDPSIRGRSDPQDRGILQINSVFHPEVSDACAFDPTCSFQAAYRISNSGTNFRAWCTAWSDGACGTRGGTYLGGGAPYQSHLQPGTTLGKLDPTVNTGSGGTNPVQAIVDFFNGLSPALAWLSSPIRVIKMVAGVMLIAIALYLLIVPEAAQKAGKFIKSHPEVLAA